MKGFPAKIDSLVEALAIKLIDDYDNFIEWGDGEKEQTIGETVESILQAIEELIGEDEVAWQEWEALDEETKEYVALEEVAQFTDERNKVRIELRRKVRGDSNGK